MTRQIRWRCCNDTTEKRGLDPRRKAGNGRSRASGVVMQRRSPPSHSAADRVGFVHSNRESMSLPGRSDKPFSLGTIFALKIDRQSW